MSLSWLTVRGQGGARLTAAGAPGRAGLLRWVAAGATAVLTLQRPDEHAPWLPTACAEAGLDWQPLPLSGRRLEHPQDRHALDRLPEILAWLSGRSVVVHCSAGLHRTGLCLYLLLRHAGYPPDEACAAIALARPLTAEELCRPTRRHGSLRDLAETLFSPPEMPTDAR